MGIRFSLFLFFLAVLLIGALILLSYQFYSPLKFDGEKKFVVEMGQNVSQIGDNLERSGLIRGRWWFDFYLFLHGSDKSLKAGEYVFHSGSLSDIVEQLVRGEPRKQIILTFIEGWTRKQMGEYVEVNTGISYEEFMLASGKDALASLRNSFSFLDAVPDDHTLEGFLFPDTYIFFEDVEAKDIVRKMLETFDHKLNSDMRRAIKAREYSIFDAVTMASIIEREVRTVDDMELVSGVFWKRIESGVPLQADSTINYVTEGDNPSLTIEETHIDTPYNTYLYPGLPLGPISNPGLNAIRAAVYPEKSEYWFFLSKPDGGTVFSKTLNEHNRAKQRYLK